MVNGLLVWLGLSYIYMIQKKYKPIWLPEELQRKIKTIAAKKGKTIIKYLEELIK